MSLSISRGVLNKTLYSKTKMYQQAKLKMKTKTRKVQKSSVSAFISKTYEFLEDSQFPDIVDWNFEGTAIVIKNPLEFAQKVLNIYFKHRNLTSFVRQLNMYGFHKQRTHKVEYVYSHELFQRGKKHLLDQIKRKNQEQISIDSSEPTEETESEASSPDLSALLQEKQALKRYNIQAFDKINCLEGKVKDLTVQNQALKDQLSSQGERDKILISLMANILQKYGIPPGDLSSVMKEGVADPLLQALTNAQEPQLTRLPSNSSELNLKFSESNDISNYLNLGTENVAIKTATNVLYNMTNVEEKGFNRDISPYGRANRMGYEQPQWDSNLNQRSFVPCCAHREERKENLYQGALLKPHYIQEKDMGVPSTSIPIYQGEANLLKRRFEEENSFVDETYEVIKKKIETVPLLNRGNDFYGNNNMYDQRMKSYVNEDILDVPFYNNYKQMPWV